VSADEISRGRIENLRPTHEDRIPHNTAVETQLSVSH
jgi:hypothetical protein